MAYRKVHEPASASSRGHASSPSGRYSSFAPARPTAAAETDPDIEAFQQDKFEAFGLKLGQKNGTITPEGLDRLGVLQAKMADFWDRRLHRAQGRESETGMPAPLKERVENFSGVAMDDVRVHHNSDKPAQLRALAYAQGPQIHLAPGQEGLLPHEAWHVVQQKQGRVIPTLRAPGLAINDDAGLEREADDFGARAARGGENALAPATRLQAGHPPPVIQGYFVYDGRPLRSMIPEIAALFQGTGGFAATLADYQAKQGAPREVYNFMNWFNRQYQQRGWRDEDVEKRGQDQLKVSVSEVIGNLIDGRYVAPNAQQAAVPEAASAATTADPTSATDTPATTAEAAATAATSSSAAAAAAAAGGSASSRKSRKRKTPSAAAAGDASAAPKVEPATSKAPPEALEALRARKHRKVWRLKKSQKELACWNWALNALGPEASVVNPRLFPDYLHGLLSAADKAKLGSDINRDLERRLKTLGAKLKKQKMTMKQLFDKPDPKGKELEKFRERQRDAIAEMGRIIVEANGFTLATHAPAEAEIVLQYKLSDGVSWEHWWIELLGGGDGPPVIIGTDSGRESVEVDDDEAHMTGGVPDMGFEVIRYQVTGLKAGHIKALQAIAAKYAAAAPAAAPAPSSSSSST